MSGLIPSHDVVVVHEGDAEILGSGPVTAGFTPTAVPPAAR